MCMCSTFSFITFSFPIQSHFMSVKLEVPQGSKFGPL